MKINGIDSTRYINQLFVYFSAPNPSEEQNHLTEALAGMENVAEHINEMQRIHEEYGAIFDHLYRQYQRSNRYNYFFMKSISRKF